MSLDEWAEEVGQAFMDSCGERGRFEATYALPKEFYETDAVQSIRIVLGGLMPRAALEIWIDGHSRLNIRKHLT